MVLLGKRGHCTFAYKAFARFMYCERFPNLCFGLFISVRGSYEEQILHNFMYCTSIKFSPIAASFLSCNKLLTTPRWWRFSPMYSSRSLKIVVSTFRCMIHF